MNRALLFSLFLIIGIVSHKFTFVAFAQQQQQAANTIDTLDTLNPFAGKYYIKPAIGLALPAHLGVQTELANSLVLRDYKGSGLGLGLRLELGYERFSARYTRFTYTAKKDQLNALQVNGSRMNEKGTMDFREESIEFIVLLFERDFGWNMSFALGKSITLLKTDITLGNSRIDQSEYLNGNKMSLGGHYIFRNFWEVSLQYSYTGYNSAEQPEFIVQNYGVYLGRYFLF